ncbi:MAG: sigma-54-dependent Fis family transcriptional regulator, partial [Planctomycetia bacterium]|nr:sigma-54-dependent Fis family transcriptional regulator [Planctomycetia bacterium]
WPGNIRQLINVVERAKILADDYEVLLEDLPGEVTTPGNRETEIPSLAQIGPALTHDLTAVQRTHIVEVLNRERGNKARSARALGVNRRTLYRLIEKHGLDSADFSDGGYGA